MADRKPLKVLPDGGGDSAGLSEFVAADTIGVVDGGTGLATVATSNILTGNGTSALSAESNLTFDGTTLNVVGNAGVGIARTDGTLHVHTASAGSVTASAHYDDLVVEGSGNTGISILAPEDYTSGIAFGSDADNDIGYIYAQQSGTAGSRFMAFGVNASERMRVLSGGGIAFNGDTAAANALDDYEEGTWTPVIKYDGASGTAYSTSGVVATYVKIGKQVTVAFNVTITNPEADNDTSSVILTGLPFTSENIDQGWRIKFTVAKYNSPNSHTYGYVVQDSTLLALHNWLDTNAASTVLTSSNIYQASGDAYIAGTGTYWAA